MPGRTQTTHLLDGAILHERGVKVVLLQAHDEASEDLLEGLREGAGLEHSVLGATHLGGSDELHGGGDLLGVLHGTNTVTELLDARPGHTRKPGHISYR